MSLFVRTSSAARAVATILAGAALAASPLLPDAEGEEDRHCHYGQNHCCLYIHKLTGYQIIAVTIKCAAKAQAQAMAHWKTTTYTAHLSPNSLFTAAIAATQGV